MYLFNIIYKTPIRITDSISFDYADLPYHLITSSPQSRGLPSDTFLGLLKSPQKFILTSFLSENQCSILNYTAWRNGGEVSATSAIPPHVFVYSRLWCFIEKVLSRESCAEFTILMVRKMNHSINYERFPF